MAIATSKFMNIIGIILIIITIVFMLYCCGCIINDCINHPNKFGIVRDACIHPTTAIAVDIENAVDAETVVFVQVNP